MLPQAFRPGVIRILAVTFSWRVYIAHALGPELSVLYQILIEKVVENASLNVQALDPDDLNDDGSP